MKYTSLMTQKQGNIKAQENLIAPTTVDPWTDTLNNRKSAYNFWLPQNLSYPSVSMGDWF